MYNYFEVDNLHEAYEQAVCALVEEGESYFGENQDKEEMMFHTQLHIKVRDMSRLTLTRACIQPPEEVDAYVDEFLNGVSHDGFSYTYHSLYSPYYDKAISELRRNPNSRRAVLPLAGEKSYGLYPPCLQIMLPKIRHGKLNMTVLFRSNDLIQAFPQNTFAIGRLMHKMADDLDVKVGSLNYIGDDLHVYNNCFSKLFAYHDRIMDDSVGFYEWRDGKWLGWDE